jgi:hypothetical protein
MFWAVSLSIIRSFLSYTQQWCNSYRFADSLQAGSGYSSSVGPVPLNIGYLYTTNYITSDFISCVSCDYVYFFPLHISDEYVPIIKKQLYLCDTCYLLFCVDDCLYFKYFLVCLYVYVLCFSMFMFVFMTYVFSMFICLCLSYVFSMFICLCLSYVFSMFMFVFVLCFSMFICLCLCLMF